VHGIEKPIIVFYYSGHGVQFAGEDYLFADDANPAAEPDPNSSGIGFTAVISTIVGDNDGAVGLFYFDADRIPPSAKPETAETAPQSELPGEVFLGFSTSPGASRADPGGANGAYAAALARNFKIPGVGVQEAMMKVGSEVMAVTGGHQIPWSMSMLSRNVFFGPPRLGN
jgi:uncharacterized caspase-like protein